MPVTGFFIACCLCLAVVFPVKMKTDTKKEHGTKNMTKTGDAHAPPA
jgi:hypothetical protein